MDEYVKMPPKSEQEMLMVKPEYVDRLHNKLTAAEEQLVEMREALEAQLEELGLLYDYLDGFPTSIDDLLGKEFMLLSERATALANKALSAAPKRGRVVWEGNGRIREEAGYHEDEQSSYHYTTYYVEPLKITDFDSFLVGTDLDAKCKWLYNDLLVTVTVREAE